MRNLDKFHVIVVLSNPIRYQSRYKLYEIFQEDMTRKGGALWTVELQGGARLHKVTDTHEDRHTQLSGSLLPGELWHKENLINLAIQQLSIMAPDWRYVMWCDADIKFEQGAIYEVAEALQHWDIVQCWSHAIDLGPQGETIGRPHQSFMYCYWKGIQVIDPAGYLGGGHPGFAWAARRDALNKLGAGLSSGPLIDWGILGSADRHMAAGWIGRIGDSVHKDMHPNYLKWLKLWQARAEKTIRRNVGFSHGTIRHMWHGRKADRGYSSRWKILVKNQFDPEADLVKDVSGVWQLVSDCPRQMMLRDDIRKYFRARREDATTTD